MKINRPALSILGASALVVALVMASAPSVGASPTAAQVTVTNTPLPVSGTLGAAQQGTWTVGIDPAAPPVKVLTAPTTAVTLVLDDGSDSSWQNTTPELVVIDSMNCYRIDGTEYFIVRAGEAWAQFPGESAGALLVKNVQVKFYIPPQASLTAVDVGGQCTFNGHLERYGGLITNSN